MGLEGTLPSIFASENRVNSILIVFDQNRIFLGARPKTPTGSGVGGQKFSGLGHFWSKRPLLGRVSAKSFDRL